MIGIRLFPDRRIDLHVRHQDIVEYINKRIDGEQDIYTEQLRGVIKSELGRKSENSFLWTSVVLNEIIKIDLPTKGEIRIQLSASFKGLYGELFARILDRSRDKALLILLWIT